MVLLVSTQQLQRCGFEWPENNRVMVFEYSVLIALGGVCTIFFYDVLVYS